MQFAKTLCRALAVFHGWQYRSKFVANMSFMGYNKGPVSYTHLDVYKRQPPPPCQHFLTDFFHSFLHTTGNGI